jgi:hypothetical protein
VKEGLIEEGRKQKGGESESDEEKKKKKKVDDCPKKQVVAGMRCAVIGEPPAFFIGQLIPTPQDRITPPTFYFIVYCLLLWRKEGSLPFSSCTVGHGCQCRSRKALLRRVMGVMALVVIECRG